MPAVKQETFAIAGEIAAWRVVRDGWGIGRLQTALESIPFTGTLVGVEVGNTVELVGVWDVHERWGKQLKVKQCTVTRPDTPDGVVAWLAATLPGIGLHRARAVLDHFGGVEGLWQAIEHTPERLAEVDGITEARVLAIQSSYLANRGDRDHMIALRGWGLTDAQISRCIDAWCKNKDGKITRSVGTVVDRIRLNPYELSQHVYGFGFLRADKVAMKVGIAPDAAVRLEAGVEHVLDEAATAGHCFLPGAVLQKESAKLLGVDPARVVPAIKSVAATGRIVRRGWRIYPQRLERAEARVANRLAAFIGGSKDEASKA